MWLALLQQYDLSAAERRMLVVCRREGWVTPRRLRDLLTGARVEDLLRGAVGKGLVRRVGQGGTRYVLADEVVLRAGAGGLEARRRRRQRVIDELARRGSLTTAEAAEVLRDSPVAARQVLNDLVREGVATADGNTRARRYLSRTSSPNNTSNIDVVSFPIGFDAHHSRTFACFPHHFAGKASLEQCSSDRLGAEIADEWGRMGRAAGRSQAVLRLVGQHGGRCM